MKKLILLLVMVLSLGMLFIGCTPAVETAEDNSSTSETASDAAEDDTVAEEVQAEDTSDMPKKIGWVVNILAHEWYQNVTGGAQVRADELGIELLLADANLDNEQSIAAAENYITQGVDVLIMTPVDAKALGAVITQAEAAGIPVITESNYVEGALTRVGIMNVDAGKKAGEWLAEYAPENGIEKPKILIVGAPAFEDGRKRVEGFLAGLDESGFEYETVEVDGSGVKETAMQVSTDALTANPDVTVIFGINDDSTTGAIAAYQAAGMDESKLTAVSFGLEGSVGWAALLEDTPYKAALAMFPNYVGFSAIDAAVAAYKGEELGDDYITPTIVITEDNFFDFYEENGEGYDMIFENIGKIVD